MTEETPTPVIHPLRAAVVRAEAERAMAQHAIDCCENEWDPVEEMLQEAGELTEEHPRYVEFLNRRDAALAVWDVADAAVDRALRALAGSDCPRSWDATDTDGCWIVTASSPEEALELATRGGTRANYEYEAETEDDEVDLLRSWAIEVSVHCGETDEELSTTVVLDPVEPPCAADDGHDWQRPLAIVGGNAENPGVRATYGGIVVDECCMRCGCRRTRDTNATSAHGTSFEQLAYAPEAYVDLLPRLQKEQHA
jgi:hypothetical protein